MIGQCTAVFTWLTFPESPQDILHSIFTVWQCVQGWHI